jgi:hypothetical protein
MAESDSQTGSRDRTSVSPRPEKGSPMTSTRKVRKHPSGRWDILREGDRRAAVRVETKEKALARARDQVRREGGGEVRVVNDAGKIVRSSRIKAQPGRGARRAKAA